jgi:hypothetical protein
MRYGDSPSDFEYKLSNIASEFKYHIMDKDECESLVHEAGSVANDIDDALDNKDNYSSEEVIQYKELKKKAEALEEYLGAVGGGSLMPTKEQFQMANSMVGGSVSVVSQGKYCVDFISVTIYNYVVYLAENNTVVNYTVSYNCKSLNGLNCRSGTMGLLAKSCRYIYDNREKPAQKSVTVYGVKCVPFKTY